MAAISNGVTNHFFCSVHVCVGVCVRACVDNKQQTTSFALLGLLCFAWLALWCCLLFVVVESYYSLINNSC